MALIIPPAAIAKDYDKSEREHHEKRTLARTIKRKVRRKVSKRKVRVVRRAKPRQPQSWIERLAQLPAKQRDRILAEFSPYELRALEFDWQLWRRESQTIPKGDWDIWLIEAGRGFGKTRTGAETVREWVEQGVMRIALIARTADDARATMIEEGILTVFPPHQYPKYEPSKRKITFHTGAVARIFTAEEPDIPRGKQQEKAWFDEASSFDNLKEIFDNVMLGLRIGKKPQAIVTTTPKSKKEYREIFKSKRSKYSKYRKVVTHGSSYENAANLSSLFINAVIKPFEGTRKGKQELYGQFLDDATGALWTSALIDRYRAPDVRLDRLTEIVVAIDPSVEYNEDSAECGIVIVARHRNGHAYVLGDWTIHAPPVTKAVNGEDVKGWAQHGVEAFYHFDADVIVGEVNNGGELVEAVIAQVNKERVKKSPATIVFESVRASKGKRTRAEPVAMLYDKGIVHHVQSADLELLEEQMTTWEPGEDSPDRLDALVWALTYLYLGDGGEFEVLSRAVNWKGIL